MFHGKIALRVVRLLLLVNFVSEFRLKLMYISLIVSFWSSLMCAAAIVFFVCTNILNLLNLKTFRQAFLKVLEAAKLAYANQTESITSQRLRCRDFWRITNCVFNKGKSAISPLFNGPDVLSSVYKAKLFAKNVSENFNFDDSGISLPVLPFRTNLKLHNISVTSRMIKKVQRPFIHQRVWS